MKGKVFFAGITVLFLLSFIKLPVYADSSNLYRSAGTIEPIENKNVTMVEENVYIKVFGGTSAARCEFVFKNDSTSEQDVLMGFPASRIMEGSVIDETTKLSDFKVFENGEEKPAKLEKAKDISKTIQVGDISEWYTWNVHFKGGEEKRIENTYTAQNYDAPWARRVGYILKTGAPWKGNIGKATITFELMDISPAKINTEYTKPAGYRIEKNKVIWEYKNFEPEEDIGMTFDKGSSIVDAALNGINETEKSDVSEMLQKAHTLFMADKYEEGLKILNSLTGNNIYNELVYFYLLNYYLKEDNEEMFIKTLKDEVSRLNNPRIYEWALAVYPDRVKEEDLGWPEEHKPVIRNENIRILDGKTFELTADLHDEARDMMFLTVNSWSDPLSLQSLFEGDSAVNLFGKKDYIYRNTGVLPDKYSTLVYCLDVTDYAGNSAFSTKSSGYNPGESCFFYTGSSLEQWKVENEDQFILCYYEDEFTRYESDFKNELKKCLMDIQNKLGIKVPEGGYAISLYDSSHLEKLNRESAQNMTRVVKRNYYNSRVHNGEELDKDKWDWDEIIVGIDNGNAGNMVESAVKQVMRKNFGYQWLTVDSKLYEDFMAALAGKPGSGPYYDLFSGMSRQGLKTAADEIGLAGNVDKYIAQEGNQPVPAIKQDAVKSGDVNTPGSIFILIGAMVLVAFIGFILFLFYKKRRVN